LLQDGSPIPQDLLITKADKACCTAALSHALSIFSDGSVIVEEIENTNGVVKRTVRGKMSEGDLRRLVSEFDKANYFSLNDQYVNEKDGCPEVWSDADTVTTSIKIGGREKTIRHFWGCEQKGSPYPAELTALEEKIDEIVDVRKLLYPTSH
jgi:hypothetical protein